MQFENISIVLKGLHSLNLTNSVHLFFLNTFISGRKKSFFLMILLCPRTKTKYHKDHNFFHKKKIASRHPTVYHEM